MQEWMELRSDTERNCPTEERQCLTIRFHETGNPARSFVKTGV